jgi:16S rRNA (guanine1207-N2)-methyltransferase
MVADLPAATGADPALDALFLPLERGLLPLGAAPRVLFLRARHGAALQRHGGSNWHCVQSFKPEADRLQASGWQVAAEPDDEAGHGHDLVLLLPPRQRDEARAAFALALQQLADGGTLLASVANNAGARSAEADLASLAGPLHSLSKHKCRVFWTTPTAGSARQPLAEAWLADDRIQPIAGGAYLSRPGLFAWDRIDPASALLAAQLPEGLAGDAADLGGGYGLLSCELLRRCPRIAAIDLYEAEARALEPARQNLQRHAAEHGREVALGVHWHDVLTGLPRQYDVIVSNPPFHQGRADLPALGRGFIRSAAAALRPGGVLWLVANRHLPYESTLAECFDEVRCAASGDGFKVFEARRHR